MKDLGISSNSFAVQIHTELFLDYDRLDKKALNVANINYSMWLCNFTKSYLVLDSHHKFRYIEQSSQSGLSISCSDHLKFLLLLQQPGKN